MFKEVKSFFITSILFLIVFFISFIILDMLSNKLIYHDKRIYKKEIYTNNFFSNVSNKKQIKIGFFGNSHIIHGINPKYIDNSYNFAFNGNRYTEDYFILSRAINDFNIDFKTVVFQIDLNSFGLLNIRPNYINHLEVRHKYIPISEIATLNKMTLYNVYLSSYSPFLQKDFMLLVKQKMNTKTKFNSYGKYFYNGWQSFNRTNGNWEIMKNNYELVDMTNLKYFLKSIELAKEKNINIIFVMMPMSKEFDSKLLNPIQVRKKYYKKLFPYVNKILNNYIVLDYYCLFFNEESKILFSDLNHLNSIGSKKFSLILGQYFNEKTENKKNTFTETSKQVSSQKCLSSTYTP